MKEIYINRACPPNTQCFEWINVEDRMPEVNSYVLVYIPSNHSELRVEIMRWEDIPYVGCPNPHWYNADYHISISNYPKITHWAKFPKGPHDK